MRLRDEGEHAESVLSVQAIAGDRARGGPQDPGRLVEAQRLPSHSGAPGELSDAQSLIAHAATINPAPWGRVKPDHLVGSRYASVSVIRDDRQSAVAPELLEALADPGPLIARQSVPRARSAIAASGRGLAVGGGTVTGSGTAASASRAMTAVTGAATGFGAVVPQPVPSLQRLLAQLMLSVLGAVV